MRSSASRRLARRSTTIRAQRTGGRRRACGSSSSSRRDAEQDLDGERGALAGELRAAYVNGREEELKLLLNQEDPATFGRMLQYYGYFGRARAERIARHPGQARAPCAGARQDRRRARRGSQDTRAAARSARWLRCAPRRTGARRPWQRSTAQIKSRGGELQRLAVAGAVAREADRGPAQGHCEDVAGREAGAVRAAARQAAVAGAAGTVLARFGQPRAGGSMRWQGMLIGTERGARVRAPYAGRVVYADWLPGMGLMLVVDHGGGYMSLYGHNEELFRKVGETGRRRRRHRLRRRHRRPQPAGALFRGPSRPPAGRSGDLAAAPVAVGIMFNADRHWSAVAAGTRLRARQGSCSTHQGRSMSKQNGPDGPEGLDMQLAETLNDATAPISVTSLDPYGQLHQDADAARAVHRDLRSHRAAGLVERRPRRLPNCTGCCRKRSSAGTRRGLASRGLHGGRGQRAARRTSSCCVMPARRAARLRRHRLRASRASEARPALSRWCRACCARRSSASSASSRRSTASATCSAAC